MVEVERALPRNERPDRPDGRLDVVCAGTGAPAAGGGCILDSSMIITISRSELIRGRRGEWGINSHSRGPSHSTLLSLLRISRLQRAPRALGGAGRPETAHAERARRRQHVQVEHRPDLVLVAHVHHPSALASEAERKRLVADGERFLLNNSFPCQ